jgi:putative phosphoribosyl transferase
MRFADRGDAGRHLAERLAPLRVADPVVVGIPRGGVPVAFEVARTLGAPLDVIVVRKLGVPFQPELGMGAIGEDGVRVLNREVLGAARVSESEIAAVEARERGELERRAARFRQGRSRLDLTGRTVIVVDDGIATGSTARAACEVARVHGAARVVLATPVAPTDWIGRLGSVADEFVCLATPEPFYGVGQFYDNFNQTTDEQVIACLDRAARWEAAAAPAAPRRAADPTDRRQEVNLAIGPAGLSGTLTVPDDAAGVVVFAHGSGSSRHSPRNRAVATVLNRSGLATLLFDLLSAGEAADRTKVFDISLLSRRLIDATRWLEGDREVGSLPVAYFGASTGAAAALWAAAEPGVEVAAVVSRGGRPDLAGPRLAAVRAPTLLIVGGLDTQVLELNRQAQARLRCPSRLAVVPGATHLFEEPGTLAMAATLARDWFVENLAHDAPANARRLGNASRQSLHREGHDREREGKS